LTGNIFLVIVQNLRLTINLLFYVSAVSRVNLSLTWVRISCDINIYFTVMYQHIQMNYLII